MDGKPRIATEKDLNLPFRKKFQCNLCGHKFKVGDQWRFIYANAEGSNGSGNFTVCSGCDGDDVLTRGRDSFKEAVKLAQNWDIYGPDWQKAQQELDRKQERQENW